MVLVPKRDAFVASSAIAFFLVLVADMIVPQEALPDDDATGGVDTQPTSDEIHSFFARNYGMQQAKMLLHTLAAGAFLVFAAALTRAMHETEPSGGPWSRVAFGAGIGIASVIVVAMGFVSALLQEHQNLDGQTLLAFYHAGWALYFKINYVVPIFLGAIAAAGFRGSALPRWLAWTGAIFAGLTFLSIFGNLRQDTAVLPFVVFFLLMLWVLMVGIVALTRGLGPAASPAPAVSVSPGRKP